MKKSFIVVFFLFFFLSINAQEKIISKDSLNIPVILVDGVEVQSLDSVCKEDIIEVKVIKDKNIIKYFYPRVGGIMCITTKSKKFLTPIIQEYIKNIEINDKNKKKGEIYIRQSIWIQYPYKKDILLYYFLLVSGNNFREINTPTIYVKKQLIRLC